MITSRLVHGIVVLKLFPAADAVDLINEQDCRRVTVRFGEVCAHRAEV